MCVTVLAGVWTPAWPGRAGMVQTSSVMLPGMCAKLQVVVWTHQRSVVLHIDFHTAASTVTT
jgi:hypothetical protein